mmetsp:Transcript_123775/g.309433  ORF Transcript_123775/g.309433 Transcript_123775/m.309433 type:complete len:109 (-) Transcript_123775:116-442(-)
MARSAARLPAVFLAAACLLALRWAAAPAFVPPATTEGAASGLRGAPAVAAGAAAAGAPLAVYAADELLAYNMAGEWTSTFIAGYFILTLGYTAVAFVSYLVLTKLKII